jgi:putative methyltransferase (TIGR04325 family)
MNVVDLARTWLPPILTRAAARWLGRSQRFDGHPADWAAACRACAGYGDDQIIDRVARATREVVDGRAAFERDSVLFDQPQFPFQLLAPLLRHAARHGNVLEVVDFGGSLGSTWRQCRPFLPDTLTVRWHVVEQKAFVDIGRAEFQTAELRFHDSLTALPPARAPRLLLASSVLQYLPRPQEVVDEWAGVGATTLVIDRTPIADRDDDSLCIQTVPRHIYPASYPCWLLSRRRLLEQLAPHWTVLSEFESAEGRLVASGGREFAFQGLILDCRR